jgi:hypothetical protein
MQLKTFGDFEFASDLYRSTLSCFDDSEYLEQKCYIKMLVKHLFFVEKKKYLVINQQLTQDFSYEMFNFFDMNTGEK